MRLVRPAANASAVQPSSISCSGGPIIAIWKRWSITHRLVSPASSAREAMRAKFSPMCSWPSGQVKLGT
jgi:hypothetical protein